jgi:hypothetical protein
MTAATLPGMELCPLMFLASALVHLQPRVAKSA